MIEKLYITLAVIYKNRYRELTYKDKSAFYIPLLAYLFAIYKIYIEEFPSFPRLDLVPYFLASFSFSFCIIINNRKDNNLLNLIFTKKYTYFILFLDLLISNTLQLLICIKINRLDILLITLGCITFFTFYKNKVNSPLFKSFIQPLNILLKTQLRRYKFIYILIIICYYLAYQGLIVENKNLFIIAILAIIYILFDAVSKTEKLEYFIFSNYNQRQYILKNEFAFLIDSCIFLIPILILSIIYQPNYNLNLFITLLTIPCLFPLKYIYFNRKIVLAFTSLGILIFNSIILSNDTIDYWLIISIIPLVFILHLIAFRKFTKEKIQDNIELYL